MDAQTFIIIAALAGMMTALVRINNTNTRRLDERLVTQIDAVKTELAGRVDALEKHTDQRIDALEAEIGALRGAVLTMDGRLYDLATGRHAPLIIPSH